MGFVSNKQIRRTLEGSNILDRKLPEGVDAKGSRMRTKSTIKRLKMYKNFKPVRYNFDYKVHFYFSRYLSFSDSKGKIIKEAPFQGKLDSGTVARVEPHRKWFGMH